VLDSYNAKSIEDLAYGKGYMFVYEEFLSLIKLLTNLIDQNVHVVITAHAHVKKFEQPDEIGSYDRWELKLQSSPKANIAAAIKEWADMVLFANYKTYVINTDGQGASKGKNKVQGGKRVMYTSHNPCWDAKNREGLPEEMDFDYGQIFQLFPERPKAAQPVEVPAEQLRTKTVLEGDEALSAMSARENLPSEPAQVTIPEVIHVNANNGKSEPPNGIPDELWELMLPDKIIEPEVMLAVEEAGYFPRTTPIRDLPQDYIHGVLIGAWPQVRAAILKNREDIPF
jgi:hypothetical protein